MVLTLYVLCGIPGSGKTTLARELSERYNATLCSYDDLPNANTKSSMDGSVMQTWLNIIHDTLQSGKSVVCDGLNLTVEERNTLLSAVADIQCEKVLMLKLVPLNTCLERNRQRKTRLPDFVVEQSARMFQPPKSDEGWDYIHVYRE